MAMPALFLILVVVALFGASLLNTALVISLVTWAQVARVVRAECLSLRGREFAAAARALGAGHARILGRHLLLNALPVIIVQATRLLARRSGSNTPSRSRARRAAALRVGNMVVEGRVNGLRVWIAPCPGLASSHRVGFNLFATGGTPSTDAARLLVTPSTEGSPP